MASDGWAGLGVSPAADDLIFLVVPEASARGVWLKVVELCAGDELDHNVDILRRSYRRGGRGR
jgi:hypothetical protein